MILKNSPLFQPGQRVRVEIPELNLQHGAGDEYPNNGTGIVVIPIKKVTVLVEPEPEKPKERVKKTTTKKPKLEVKLVARSTFKPDPKGFAVLQEQR